MKDKINPSVHFIWSIHCTREVCSPRKSERPCRPPPAAVCRCLLVSDQTGLQAAGRSPPVALPCWGATAALITPTRHRYTCNPPFLLPAVKPCRGLGWMETGVFGGPEVCSQLLLSPSPSNRGMGWWTGGSLSCFSHFPFHTPVGLFLKPKHHHFLPE